jgi:hypothetical protein
MSGAVSIPLALAALFMEATPRFWFTILAFISIWIFAIGCLIRSLELKYSPKKKAAQDFLELLSRLKADLHTSMKHNEAAFVKANLPVLVEAVYLLEVHCPPEDFPKLRPSLEKLRGQDVSQFENDNFFAIALKTAMEDKKVITPNSVVTGWLEELEQAVKLS